MIYLIIGVMWLAFVYVAGEFIFKAIILGWMLALSYKGMRCFEFPKGAKEFYNKIIRRL